MAEDPEQLRAQAKLWRGLAEFQDETMRQSMEAKARELEQRADRLRPPPRSA
jgi:hypothetical protein